MSEAWLAILWIALVADWFFGEPPALWSRLGHPVVWFGRAVDRADRAMNLESDGAGVRRRKGTLAIAALAGGAALVGGVLQSAFAVLGPLWWIGEAAVVFVLVAQKSLADHVRAVARGLAADGLAGGRGAVGKIVGRDPNTLDESGVVRAAIESLAENFCDGVVAPAFWYAIAGLPGLLAYKMINTADSMIGHLSERHGDFGRAAARLDDIANWLPARFSLALIAAGAGAVRGLAAARNAFAVALRDAGLHRSPNAGWPEAAMAGACDIALGGPRSYGGETVEQGFIHGAGRRELVAGDIEIALKVFAAACYALWALAAVLWLA